MHRTNAESIALSKGQFNTANVEFRKRIRDANLMCQIHSAYNSFDWSVKSHNCIGCNLDQSTKYISLILDVASENKQEFEPQELVAMFVIPLNSLYERIEDILNIIDFARKYRETKLQEFKTARRWANFFKHPKAFGWLVHHPHYTIESSKDHCALMADTSGYIFVENDFLGKYYSSSATENAKKWGRGHGVRCGIRDSVSFQWPFVFAGEPLRLISLPPLRIKSDPSPLWSRDSARGTRLAVFVPLIFRLAPSRLAGC